MVQVQVQEAEASGQHQPKLVGVVSNSMVFGLKGTKLYMKVVTKKLKYFGNTTNMQRLISQSSM